MTAPQTAPARLTDLPGTWTLDAAHSLAAFSVRHMTIARVTGRFHGLAGEVWVGPETAAVRVRIATDSVTSGHPLRDELIRSPEFLDAAGHPTLTFEAEVPTSVLAAGEVGERWTLPGTLTLRGVRQPVEWDVRTGGVVAHRGAVRAGFSAATRIDRRDFGLAFAALMAGGGAVVGTEVALIVEAELVGPNPGTE